MYVHIPIVSLNPVLTMRYKNTFICVAEDCPVTKSEVPVSVYQTQSVPQLQYNLLSRHPYKLNYEELNFEVFLQQKGHDGDLPDLIVETLRQEFLKKKHPSLRALALVKRYGFGLHCDDEGKIALYPVESPEYEAILQNRSVEKLHPLHNAVKEVDFGQNRVFT